MNPSLLHADRRRPARSGGAAGFTMVEIALCLAIIAFALVAIIGVLPTGLRVQRDNREDTVINQDATYFIEAIRSGSRGLDDLTNLVDSVTISNSAGLTFIYTNAPGLNQTVGAGITLDGSLTNGLQIVSALTFPKYLFVGANIVTNTVWAYIRALSGSATDKGQSAAVKDFAFAYRLTSEVVPLATRPRELTNYQATGLSPQQMAERKELWLQDQNQAINFHELRLTLQGPVLRRGGGFDVLGTPKTFRTIMTGRLTNSGVGALVLPGSFVQIPPQP